MKNREIKFRAWDKKKNRFLTDHDTVYISDEGGCFTLKSTNYNGDYLNREDVEIVEFTGLHDKNGKEIYEGDILRWAEIKTEYQTHTGDNIPNGSYTEPIDTKASWKIKSVKYNFNGFVTDDHEGEYAPFTGTIGGFGDYDKQRMMEVCSLRNGDDGELWESVEYCCEQLEIEAKDFEDFFKQVNGMEVIGNIYENPELLKS